jgi:aspartyl-tRNA synthetase
MSSSSTPQPRTLSRELKHNIDQVVTIKGWLHKKRLLGGLTFINVRDRSGLTQVLIENKDEVEKLRGMQIGQKENEIMRLLNRKLAKFQVFQVRLIQRVVSLQ